MKKLSVFAVALLMATLVFNQSLANAETGNDQKDTTNFMKASGVITDIVKSDNMVTLTVETEVKEPLITILKVKDDVLLFNSGTTKTVEKESFEKGQRVDAYYDKNKPMILIYPAQITPELVIVRDSEKLGFVKVSKFDDNLLSLDNELKLNIAKETILVNEKGEKIEREELNNKELVVFYTNTTRSIPAQTTPSKIATINYLSAEMKEVQDLIDEDHFMQNGMKMIPLREVAEHFGYEVRIHPLRSSTFLSKGNSSISIKRGQKAYTYNKSLRQFVEKPVLKNNNMYVSEDILELFIQP